MLLQELVIKLDIAILKDARLYLMILTILKSQSQSRRRWMQQRMMQ